MLVSEEKLRALRRPAQAGGEDLGVGDDVRPWTETDQVQPDVNTLTRRRQPGVRERRRRPVRPRSRGAARLLRDRRAHPLRQPRAVQAGRGGQVHRRARPWRDGETPVNASGGLISKGHPLGATGVANLYEVATHLRGEAGDRQIEDAKVGLTHGSLSLRGARPREGDDLGPAMLPPGTEAPDHSPRPGRRIRSRCRICGGRWVLLWWYPMADTPVERSREKACVTRPPTSRA